MVNKEKPYVLFVAEKIYSEVSKIKKNNKSFSNIDAIDNFFSTETYKDISSGKFHNEWFERLKRNNLIDQNTKKDPRRNNKIIRNSKRNDD